MKRILWLLTMMSVSLLALAQDAEPKEDTDGWKKGGVISFSMSQVALSNWSAGGDNSFSGTGFFNGFANLTKENHTWDNTLILGYGLQKQNNDVWYKTNDKLEFSSKYGQKASDNWYYSGLVDFKTQFTEGFENSGDADHISNFFAPAYTNIAIGMDYKPNDNFSVMISPISGKLTFVTDTALSNKGSYGVKAGDKFRSEFGAFIKVAYKVELMENINYSTKIDLFSNYLNNPQNIDINWDNLITFQINDYFNASFIFNVIYDDDIGFDVDDNGDGTPDRQIAKLQWKEMFGLGMTYKL
jgi:hypothetical protein